MNLPYTVYDGRGDDAKESGLNSKPTSALVLTTDSHSRSSTANYSDHKKDSGSSGTSSSSMKEEEEKKSYTTDAKSSTPSTGNTNDVIRYKDLFNPMSSPSKPGPGMQASPPVPITIQSPTHSSEAFSQTSKVRNLMSRFFAVKGDMELMIARLHNLLDELHILELSRSDAKRAVLQWNNEFALLTGFDPTLEDKQRSKVFAKLAKRLEAAQNEFSAFHPKAAEFAVVTEKFYDAKIRPYTGEYDTIAVHLHAAAVAEGSMSMSGGSDTFASPTKHPTSSSSLANDAKGQKGLCSPASPDTRAAAASSLQQCLESLSIPTVPVVIHDDPYAL